MPNIEQVKAQVNICVIVARYTGGLKPSRSASSGVGRYYMGWCPFCQSGSARSRPKFWVDSHMAICNCFKCGQGEKPMDVVAFLARVEGITVSQAIEMLSSEFHIKPGK